MVVVMKSNSLAPSFLGMLVVALGFAMLYVGIQGWGNYQPYSRPNPGFAGSGLSGGGAYPGNGSGGGGSSFG